MENTPKIEYATKSRVLFRCHFNVDTILKMIVQITWKKLNFKKLQNLTPKEEKIIISDFHNF